MFQLLINGRENIDIGTIKNPREFIQYSETIDNVSQNQEDYDPTKKDSVNGF